jgi:predicted Zn-dependent protease
VTPRRFAALYNDGESARTVAVALSVSPAGVELHAATGAPIAAWPADDVVLVDPPRPGSPIRIGRLADADVRLSIADRAALDALREHCPNLRRKVAVGRRAVIRIGGLLAAAAAAVVLVVEIVIPAFATQIARLVPPAIEREIGEGVADRLAFLLGALEGRRRAAGCADPAGAAAAAALVARLAAAPASAPARPPVVRVVDSRLVNAFALPGSIVLLPRGMVAFSRNPEELAGILAHELGHLALRHPIETVIKVAGVTALFGLMIGDVAGGTVILALGRYLIQSSYTRPAERAADDYAIAALLRAGIDPAPTGEAFARLLPKDGEGPVGRALSTHPPSEERAALFRAAARPGRPALSDQQWTALKSICAVDAPAR